MQDMRVPGCGGSCVLWLSLRALGLAASRPLCSLQEAGKELRGAKEDCCSDYCRVVQPWVCVCVRERETDRQTETG